MHSPARDELRMAAKKKAAGARREPTFDDDDGPELRVTASDRASSADNAPSPKPRKRRARKKRPARGIGARIGRIAYWCLVAGLWFGIACVGVIAWTGAHLPPIQALEIPKRPPSIQIVDIQGRALARRGDLAGEPLPLREMPSYVPKAFIAIEDRRFVEAARHRFEITDQEIDREWNADRNIDENHPQVIVEQTKPGEQNEQWRDQDYPGKCLPQHHRSKEWPLAPKAQPGEDIGGADCDDGREDDAGRRAGVPNRVHVNRQDRK
jgi:hypothetical protein